MSGLNKGIGEEKKEQSENYVLVKICPSFSLNNWDGKQNQKLNRIFTVDSRKK